MTDQEEFALLADVKLPRGCGSVIYIQRNKNKPYCARRFRNNDEKGNPRYHIVGSYKTRGEAVKALLDNINKSPLDLDNAKKTFAEIYTIWYEGEAQLMSSETQRVYRGIFKKCESLHNRVYSDITATEMQKLISGTPSAVVQTRLKVLLSKLDNVADSMDIIIKHRSKFTKASTPHPVKPRVPLTDKEVSTLLEHRDDRHMYTVLLLLYTGFRIGELVNVKKSDVDLKNLIIYGGNKTHAGKGRTIPIHPQIEGIVSHLMAEQGEYLIESKNGKKQQMDVFRNNFKEVIAPYCERPHIPHECRHAFRTRLDTMCANRVCIDLLMGHQPANPGERVYCHKTPAQLREAILLLW
jgi:integrase